ncbi:twin-arginine translocation signal domain-containing protein [Candidatus Woesearchaeota archaeon]|nr:twin-arginine translocation signal domain-containing protein [Candidatus Woesearchaeota archaeon]
MNRRTFLKLLTAGAAGLALPSLEVIAAEKTTFFVSMKKNSLYTKEAFELAKDYLQNEAGVNIDFQFTAEVPRDLDHRTRLAIREQTLDEHVDFESIAGSYSPESREKAKEKWMELKGGTQGLARTKQSGIVFVQTENKGLDIINKYINAGKRKLRNAQEKKKNIENSDMPEGQKKVKIAFADVDIVCCRRNIEDAEKKLIRNAAKRLVHEIGHIAGLWHSHEWRNDGIDDMVNGVPNVMSYNDAVLKGRYGFDMAESQKAHMRAYFEGGKPFQDMKRHGFNLVSYLDEIKRQRNYKPVLKTEIQYYEKMKKLMELLPR